MTVCREIASLARTPQRGSYVAQPSIEQAHDVFEARRLIEPALLRRLFESLTPERVARLKHIESSLKLDQDTEEVDLEAVFKNFTRPSPKSAFGSTSPSTGRSRRR